MSESIIVSCAGCGKRYKAKPTDIGKSMKCACGEIIIIHAGPGQLSQLLNVNVSKARFRDQLSIEGDCPNCGEALKLKENEIHAGQDTCPSCGQTFLIGEHSIESANKLREEISFQKAKKENKRLLEQEEKKKVEEELKIQQDVDNQKYVDNASMTGIQDPSNIQVIDSSTTENATVEIIQYDTLRGSASTNAAAKMFYADRAGVRLKQVRIKIKNSRILIEPGGLHYMKGRLELKSSSGGLIKGVSRKMLAGETLFQSHIEGTGEIYLEPTFGHFLLHQLEKGDSLIVDKGIFYAGTAGISVTARMQKNISSALFGGEGLFQTEITGQGMVVLASPVPSVEIRCVELTGDKLSVDGNFAVMRTSNVEFTAAKSSKSLVGTMTSGEGLLQTFSGYGRVWIAPTQSTYTMLET